MSRSDRLALPRRRRFILVAAVATVAAMAGTEAPATPQRPTDDAAVLAVVPAGRSRAATPLGAAQAALTRDPNDLGLAVEVARLAIEQGRTWADPRRYGQAQAALAPWWTVDSPPVEARVLRAVIRQAQHDFRGALSDLDTIIAAPPRNVQARLTRAFVRMVVGDFQGAADDCANVPASVGLLPASACRARLGALTGSASSSFEALSRALAVDAKADDAMRRFATSILADMALALGWQDQADRLIAETAAIGVPDVPFLAAVADQLLDTAREADVLTLLDGKGNADVILLRQAIAAKKVGDPRLKEWSAILNERFAAAKAGGVRLHLREEARFRLEVEGDAAAALSLARENWTVQKEPADARLLLESAIAAGDPPTASDVVGFVDRTGLADVRLSPLLERVRAKT